MKRRIVCMFACISILISTCPIFAWTVSAAKTGSEGLAWVQSLVNQTVGSGECVDLIVAYYSYLGYTSPGGNAVDYASNALPGGSGWTRERGGVPQPGDILIYDGGYGHVAVFESTNVSWHQNWGGRYVKRVARNYASGYEYQNAYHSYWGCIHITGGSSPIGNFDSCTGGAGSISLRGWALDKDSPSQSIDVHVYIGGGAGAGEGHVIVANKERVDVNNAYGISGNHGFNDTIITSKRGLQEVYVYGINVGGGENALIGVKTVTINDTTLDYIPTKTIHYNNHIYARYDYTMDWTCAKNLCTSMGGHLVTVTDAAESVMVQDLIAKGSSEAYWLGATDEVTEGTWKWIANETWNFTAWTAGEPNNGQGVFEEDYLEIYKSTGLWNDSKHMNDTVCGFVLEIEPFEYSGSKSTFYGDNKYIRMDKSMTWTEAKVACEMMGGHLATITSAAEREAIKNLVADGSKYNYYLGGSDVEAEGTWQWITGEEWSYNDFWRSNQPDNYRGVENYLAMYSAQEENVPQANAVLGEVNDTANYRLNDSAPDKYAVEYNGFICEIENAAVHVSAVSLNKERAAITVGGSETLIAAITPDDAINKNVVWTSSDTAVATVAGGEVTAVALGVATITATTEDGGYSAVCTVTVEPITYSVIYDANGGSNAPTSQTKIQGVALTLDAARPKRTGFVFKEWNTKADGSGEAYLPASAYSVDADVTLYAVWRECAYTKTVVTNYEAYSVATITLYNIDTPCTICVGSYSDSMLVGAEKRTYSKDSEIFMLPKDCDSIRVMVWNENLQPITDTEVVE